MTRRIKKINPLFSTGGRAKEAKYEALKDISKEYPKNYLYKEGKYLSLLRVAF